MRRVVVAVLSLVLGLALLGGWSLYRRLVREGEVLISDLQALAGETWERPTHRPLEGLSDVNGCYASVLARGPGQKKLFAASTKPEPSLEPELGPWLEELARCSRGTVLLPTEGVSPFLADGRLSVAVHATAAYVMHLRTLVGRDDRVGALEFCADVAALARDYGRNGTVTVAAHLLESVAPECALASAGATREQRARFVVELARVRDHQVPPCFLAGQYEASVRLWSIGGWLPDAQRARFPAGVRRLDAFWSTRQPFEPFRYAARRAVLADTLHFCGPHWPSDADLLALQAQWDDSLVGGPVQVGSLVHVVHDAELMLDALSLFVRRLDDPTSRPSSPEVRVVDAPERLLVEATLSNRKLALELLRP